MNRKILPLIFLLLTACTNTTETIQQTPAGVEKVEGVTQRQTLEQVDIEKLKGNIKGSIFIKDFSVSDSSVRVQYVKDYKEFKIIDPNGKTTEENYIGYWNSGDQINKVLMGEPIRILKDLPRVNDVEMILPFQSSVYKVKWTKRDAEKYFDIDFEMLSKDQTGNLFEKEFIDKYVYDRVEREKFAALYIVKEPKEKLAPLKLSADEYIEAFNKVSGKYPEVFGNVTPNIITGPETKIFFLKVTDLIGLMGIIDGQEKLTEIRLVGITNEDQTSLSEVIVAQFFAISALDSSLSQGDVDQLLIELGMNDVKKLLEGTDKTVEKNGVAYHLVINRSDGIKLIARKAN
ncbi:hypothetical protein NDK47_17655 [Brevibacillus ruminantium]|uniref:Lipoprotein n=1 Tax=Brevibacillus ruminantium TaxID=2950604 RepID=A0ABY4W9Y5_9BACL|nr:hypothetical protein [Brevibacillus ruminantium]USG63975.1 hypothetical protein NDK47_17655 [Brevibacillus ruminantium]